MMPISRRRFLFVPALLALFWVVGGSSAALAAPSVVKWDAEVTPSVARPGETVRVTVTANIDAQYHIYSIVPVPPPGPLETTVKVEATPLKPVGELVESATKKKIDESFDNKEVALHSKTATFTRYMEVPANVAAGTIPLSVTVRFMACTDTFCLPPSKPTPVETPPLTVEAGETRPEYVGIPAEAAATASAPNSAEGASGGDSSSGASALAQEITDEGTGGSLLTFLIGAFGAGLLALVTPCVFPMIPVTLAFFTKQATKKDGETAARGSIVTLAATYSAGIIIAFTAIGAVLAATVGAAGANRVAANPWVNLAFAALFVVFGLALLEIIELRPPAFLQNATTGRRGNTGGMLGVLFMGLTFVVAAFTCTAPFIGTVLVAAASAQTGMDWVRPVLGMAAFATALALPFFLLALFPGWLARMPKSGAWLTTVKGTMGFIEIAAALKFLSNADMVWQWKLLTQPALLAAWMMIAFLGAAWLLGWFKVGFGSPEGRPTPARRIWAGVFVACGIYFLWGLTGRPLNSWVVAFLPPPEYSFGASANTGAHGEELSWHDTLEAGLAEAQAENKPIFIDFTGYTCTNCRWMEKNVFPVPAVREQMEQFVRVRLYTDDAKVGEKFQTYQEKTFGTLQLPLYAVLTPDGVPVAKPVGMVRDPQKFADYLRQSRESKAVAQK